MTNDTLRTRNVDFKSVEMIERLQSRSVRSGSILDIHCCTLEIVVAPVFIFIFICIYYILISIDRGRGSVTDL